LAPVIVDRSQAERRLELFGGEASRCGHSTRQAMPRAGANYKTVVLDECALVPDLENAWQTSTHVDGLSGRRLALTLQ